MGRAGLDEDQRIAHKQGAKKLDLAGVMRIVAGLAHPSMKRASAEKTSNSLLSAGWFSTHVLSFPTQPEVEEHGTQIMFAKNMFFFALEI